MGDVSLQRWALGGRACTGLLICFELKHLALLAWRLSALRSLLGGRKHEQQSAHLCCRFASDSPRKQVQQEQPRAVMLHPGFKKPRILPLDHAPPFPSVSICLAGLRANSPLPAWAVPYLLRLGQLPQDEVDAADVEADFGRGVLDGREGVQGCLPLLPIRCAHAFLPQTDRLHQGHGAVAAGAGSPGPSSQRCSASLCPLSASAFVSQNCQEVASLASPQAAPPWGSGAEAAVPQWVSTPSCRGLRDRSSSGFASLGFLMILSAAWLSSSNLGLQSQSS